MSKRSLITACCVTYALSVNGFEDNIYNEAGVDLFVEAIERFTIDKNDEQLLFEEMGKQKKSAEALFNNIEYYSTHPAAYHIVKAISLKKDIIQLEDGSIWRINPDEIEKIQNWLAEVDSVLIFPNHDWFTNFDYRYSLVNKNNGVAITVKLESYLKEELHTLYNYKIIAYDDVKQMIWLSDGSAWSISSLDYSTLWKIGHTVIIGINDGFLASIRPNILINANRGNYVRANCLN